MCADYVGQSSGLPQELVLMIDANNSSRFQENRRGKRRPTLARMQSLMQRPLSSYSPNDFGEQKVVTNIKFAPTVLVGSSRLNVLSVAKSIIKSSSRLTRCLKFVLVKLIELPDLLAKAIIRFLRSSFTPH